MLFRTFRLAIITTVHWPVMAALPVAHAIEMPSRTLVPTEISPMPELEPSEVTRIQLEALQSNTPENEGIALTYRFASPGNREVTGPLPRFVAMVRSPPYDRLLNHQSADFGPVGFVDGKAYQPIVVTDAVGERAGYLWILSKQGSGEFENCWMTDAVISTDENAPRQIAVQVPHASGSRS